MKRLSFLYSIVLLLFLATPVVYAQEAQSFGIKGGLAIATLSHQEKLNPQPGLQVGAFAKLGGRETLFFKGELLLTQKGSRNWNSEQPYNFRLYYLDLPLMLGTDLYKGLTLNLGIQPSVLLAGSHKSSANGNTSSRSIGSDLKTFDYSLVIGGEYFIKEDMLLGLRYNHGFVPIQSARGEFTVNNQGRILANHIITLYLGFVLH